MEPLVTFADKLERAGTEYFIEHQSEESEGAKIVEYARRISGFPQNAGIAVIGCGPRPQTLMQIREAGYSIHGVEPIAEYVNEANKRLDDSVVQLGSFESLPFQDNSLDLIIAESVLEHVDSPRKSLSEAFRSLRPGGLLYVSTTNRTRFSITGQNGEFTVKYFNWLPALVKECYVHQHLHFNPRLARFTPRPAVHWFTYSGLCALGRDVGFCAFYSKLDVIRKGDPAASSWLRRAVTGPARKNPLLRAIVLFQYGNSIFMRKRP